MQAKEEEVKIENLQKDEKKILNQSDEHAIQIIDKLFTGFVSNSQRDNTQANNLQHNGSTDYNEESIGRWLERLKCGDFESLGSYKDFNYKSNETEGLIRSYGSKFDSNISDIEYRNDSKHFLQTSHNTRNTYSSKREYTSGKYSSYLRNKIIAYSSRKEGSGNLMRTLQKMVKVLKEALVNAPKNKEFEVFSVIQNMFECEGFSLNSLQEDHHMSRDMSDEEVYSPGNDTGRSLKEKKSELEVVDEIEAEKPKESLLSENPVLITGSDEVEIYNCEDDQIHQIQNQIFLEKHEYFSFKKADSVPNSKSSNRGTKNHVLVENQKNEICIMEKFEEEEEEEEKSQKNLNNYLRLKNSREKIYTKKLKATITNRLDSIIETSHDASSFFEHKGSILSKSNTNTKKDVFFEGNFTLKEEIEKRKSFQDALMNFEKREKPQIELAIESPSQENFKFNGFLCQQKPVDSDSDSDYEEYNEAQIDNDLEGYDTIKVVQNYHSYDQLSEPKSIQSWNSIKETGEKVLQPIPCHLPENLIQDEKGENFDSKNSWKLRSNHSTHRQDFNNIYDDAFDDVEAGGGKQKNFTQKIFGNKMNFNYDSKGSYKGSSKYDFKGDVSLSDYLKNEANKENRSYNYD